MTPAHSRRLVRPALVALLVTVALAACSADQSTITGPSAPALKRGKATTSSVTTLESSSVSSTSGEPGRSGFLLSTGRGPKTR